MRKYANFCLLLAVLTWLAACGRAADERGEAVKLLGTTRGYILISIDTLRADRLGCYGYEKETSPFLDSLAARSTLFENAFVQLPGTLPSHMSIFTGLYPIEHGVFPPDGMLSPEITTLPEVFHAHGFRTAGHTEGGYVHGGYGFARGFDEFSHEANQIETDIERTLARGLSFLDGLEPEAPFFLFLHTYAVHDPYFPSKEYASAFWEGEPPPGVVEATGPNLAELNNREKPASPEAVAYYSALYDAQIRYIDGVLEEFFAELERRGLLDEVTLILTSDHGEEFLEHGKFLHTQIYQETLHVPLLIYHPAASPRRVEEVVESVDLAPTFFDLAGLEAPHAISGSSLRPLLEDHRVDWTSRSFAQDHSLANRSMILKPRETLYQLMTFRLDAEKPTWFSHRASFDVVETELEIEVASFHRLRELTISVDGEPERTVEISPDWQKIVLDLSESPGKKTITLETPGCDSPAELGVSPDSRCLSFMVRADVLERIEMYDLARDPRESQDISGEFDERIPSLYGLFKNYQRTQRARSDTKVLDPELRDHLRALGYLQ